LIEAWEYFLRYPDKVGNWALEHVEMVLIANAIAAVVGLVLGIFITGKGRQQLADTVLYVAGIIMTVPGIALLGVLIPILAMLGLKSWGTLPAVIALVLYGQLPIIRNTYTAIREVNPAMIQAGRGMGMSWRQILVRVKLPLAVPVIMAGLRNAIIINIGIATEAALVGAGGLGAPIFRGLRNLRPDLILVGAIAVAILALIVDGLLSLVQQGVVPKGLKAKQ